MKRKCLAVGIIFLFIGSAIIPSSGQILEKSSQPTSRGHWLYVGGSGPGNYTRITDAINNASDGDTVFVYSGLYQEQNIYVHNSISIIGEDKNTTIIDRCGYGFTLNKNFTNFTGFTLQNAPSGIYIPSSHNKIYNNIFTNLSYGGITVGEYCRIENNTFINGNYAIRLTQLGGHNVIQYNIIKNNQVGISSDFGNYNDVIQNNIIINNAQGIAINGYSESNVIYGNTIRNNTVGGIYIYGSSGDNITSNNITLNGKGIILEFANYEHISKNNIYLNKRNAFFYTIPILPNIFFRNYWGPRLLPIKIISGRALVIPIGYGLLGIPWFDIDLFPKATPYNI